MAGNAQNAQPQPNLPILSDIVTPQNLVPLLEDESVKKRLGELIEHMPPEHQIEAEQRVFQHDHLLTSLISCILRFNDAFNLRCETFQNYKKW